MNTAGTAAQLPMRATKPKRPQRLALAFVAVREDDCVLLRRRPESGLLGGMLEVPSTEWTDALPRIEERFRTVPLHGDWRLVPGIVAHTFTHFQLDALVYRAFVPTRVRLTASADAPRCQWIARRDLDSVALPSVMRKLIAHALRSA